MSAGTLVLWISRLLPKSELFEGVYQLYCRRASHCHCCLHAHTCAIGATRTAYVPRGRCIAHCSQRQSHKWLRLTPRPTSTLCWRVARRRTARRWNRPRRPPSPRPRTRPENTSAASASPSRAAFAGLDVALTRPLRLWNSWPSRRRRTVLRLIRQRRSLGDGAPRTRWPSLPTEPLLFVIPLV